MKKRKLVVKLHTSVTELYSHILTVSKSNDVKMSNAFVTLQKSNICSPFATERRQILEEQKSRQRKKKRHLQACQMQAVINRCDNTK